MEKNQEMLLSDIAIKTARIEAHLESQKETLDKVEEALKALEPVKRDVHNHGLVIKGFGWFIGLIVSIFTAKFFGKI